MFYKHGDAIYEFDDSYFNFDSTENPVDVEMKSTPVVNNDLNIVGPPPSNPTGYCAPTNAPSTVSSKHHQKLAQGNVLDISMKKLKKIVDPESSLRRFMLLNNIIKRQQEELGEKMMNNLCCHENANISNGFAKKEDEFYDSVVPNDIDAKMAEMVVYENNTEVWSKRNEFATEFEKPHHHDFVMENEFNARLAEAIVRGTDVEVLKGWVAETLASLESEVAAPVKEFGRKRSFTEMEDSSCLDDGWKQLHMCPAFRGLTCIDDNGNGGGDKSPEAVMGSGINGDFIPSDPRLRYTSQGEASSSSFRYR